MPTGNPLDAAEIAGHRAILYRIAYLQLRDRDEAEDAVQETLAAALQAAAGFEGRSTVRTWLIGVLKHKIVDHIRRARTRSAAEAAGEAGHDFDALFGEDGHYAETPADWGDPEQALSQARFHAVLERCLEGLPRNTARAFVMREVMGMETAEICKELAISATNCWVLLHRARTGLRLCLEQRWFAGEPGAR